MWSTKLKPRTIMKSTPLSNYLILIIVCLSSMACYTSCIATTEVGVCGITNNHYQLSSTNRYFLSGCELTLGGNISMLLNDHCIISFHVLQSLEGTRTAREGDYFVGERELYDVEIPTTGDSQHKKSTLERPTTEFNSFELSLMCGFYMCSVASSAPDCLSKWPMRVYYVKYVCGMSVLYIEWIAYYDVENLNITCDGSKVVCCNDFCYVVKWMYTIHTTYYDVMIIAGKFNILHYESNFERCADFCSTAKWICASYEELFDVFQMSNGTNGPEQGLDDRCVGRSAQNACTEPNRPTAKSALLGMDHSVLLTKLSSKKGGPSSTCVLRLYCNVTLYKCDIDVYEIGTNFIDPFHKLCGYAYTYCESRCNMDMIVKIGQESNCIYDELRKLVCLKQLKLFLYSCKYDKESVFMRKYENDSFVDKYYDIGILSYNLCIFQCIVDHRMGVKEKMRWLHAYVIMRSCIYKMDYMETVMMHVIIEHNELISYVFVVNKPLSEPCPICFHHTMHIDISRCYYITYLMVNKLNELNEYFIRRSSDLESIYDVVMYNDNCDVICDSMNVWEITEYYTIIILYPSPSVNIDEIYNNSDDFDYTLSTVCETRNLLLVCYIRDVMILDIMKSSEYVMYNDICDVIYDSMNVWEITEYYTMIILCKYPSVNIDEIYNNSDDLNYILSSVCETRNLLLVFYIHDVLKLDIMKSSEYAMYCVNQIMMKSCECAIYYANRIIKTMNYDMNIEIWSVYMYVLIIFYNTSDNVKFMRCFSFFYSTNMLYAQRRYNERELTSITARILTYKHLHIDDAGPNLKNNIDYPRIIRQVPVVVCMYLYILMTDRVVINYFVMKRVPNEYCDPLGSNLEIKNFLSTYHWLVNSILNVASVYTFLVSGVCQNSQVHGHK